MNGSVRDSALLCQQAAVQIAALSTAAKNSLLRAMADALEAQAPTILAANAEDMQAARGKGIGEAMLDRLVLDDGRVHGIAEALRQVAELAGGIVAQGDFARVIIQVPRARSHR